MTLTKKEHRTCYIVAPDAVGQALSKKKDPVLVIECVILAQNRQFELQVAPKDPKARWTKDPRPAWWIAHVYYKEIDAWSRLLRVHRRDAASLRQELSRQERIVERMEACYARRMPRRRTHES